MPNTTEWQAIGARLSAEVDTLRTRVEQLIAAGVENPDLAEQTITASLIASGITSLLFDLEDHAKTATNQPA